jgi:hypothetical protein
MCTLILRGIERMGRTQIHVGRLSWPNPVVLIGLVFVTLTVGLLSQYYSIMDIGTGLRRTAALPGVLFGVVLACCCAKDTDFDLWRMPVLIIGTTLAWYAAVQTAHEVSDLVKPYFTDGKPDGPLAFLRLNPPDFMVALCGVPAGFVGALGTWLSIAIVIPRARSLLLGVRIVSFGTMAAAAFEMVRYAIGSEPVFAVTFFLVHFVWQLGIAWLILHYLNLER